MDKIHSNVALIQLFYKHKQCGRKVKDVREI